MKTIAMGPKSVEFEPRTQCPLHEGASKDANDLRLIARIHDPLTERNFEIRRCAACGVGLTDPFPTEDTVGRLYEGRESTSAFDPIRGTVIDRLKDYRARVDLRRIHSIGGRPQVAEVLDFGTGNGRFAMQCRQVFRGCTVDAVDFDPEPPEALRPDGIRYLSIEAFRAHEKLYDLILLRHVVEHVHHPIEFLTSMANRLSRSGIMYIEVPNLESAQARLFGRIANQFSVPFHLFHFNVKSLGAVCRAAQLRSTILPKGMPFAGGIVTALLHQERNIAHQVAGIVLHPIQMALDAAFGKPCLAAVCTRDSWSGEPGAAEPQEPLRVTR